ncbi:tripartite motif-containing protein 14-like [Polypterus senegalus]|uniref:tripartite motif-containing protein 14-like n=1 Tax=Polypterus senegalus TaxID=55291 RepID=UPI0019641980|nr:tripartite motif-containing protein 14-like [Polypterus senegalus]
MAEGCSGSTLTTCSICQRLSQELVKLSCHHALCINCAECIKDERAEVEPCCVICRNESPSSDHLSLCDLVNSETSQIVQCNFCLESPLPAEKTCLTCMASFCQTHLRPHLMEAFRSHQLIPPCADVRDCCCPEHDKPCEMFCKECKACICSVCPILGKHQDHYVSFIQEESKEKKENLRVCLTKIQLNNRREADNIRQIQKAALGLKESSAECKLWLSIRFTELRLLLDQEEKAAKSFVEQQTQSILQMYDGHVQACEETIAKNESFMKEAQRIFKHDNPIHLLTEFTAAERDIQQYQRPVDQINPVPVSFQNIQKYISGLKKSLEAVFKKPLQSRLNNGAANTSSGNFSRSLMHVTNCSGDKSHFLKHGRSPIFDPESLHPRLRLDESKETVSCAWLKSSVPDGPLRFNKLLQAFARDSYFAGSHYWEMNVQLSNHGWWVGAAYQSLCRKGDSEYTRLGWNKVSWCLKRYDWEYWAFHDGEKVPVKVDEDPEKVGIFLDYEAGTLSFFDATSSMKHLFTFKSQFSKPVYPAVRLWKGPVSFCKLT